MKSSRLRQDLDDSRNDEYQDEMIEELFGGEVIVLDDVFDTKSRGNSRSYSTQYQQRPYINHNQFHDHGWHNLQHHHAPYHGREPPEEEEITPGKYGESDSRGAVAKKVTRRRHLTLESRDPPVEPYEFVESDDDMAAIWRVATLDNLSKNSSRDPPQSSLILYDRVGPVYKPRSTVDGQDTCIVLDSNDAAVYNDEEPVNPPPDLQSTIHRGTTLTDKPTAKMSNLRQARDPVTVPMCTPIMRVTQDKEAKYATAGNKDMAAGTAPTDPPPAEAQVTGHRGTQVPFIRLTDVPLSPCGSAAEEGMNIIYEFMNRTAETAAMEVLPAAHAAAVAVRAKAAAAHAAAIAVRSNTSTIPLAICKSPTWNGMAKIRETVERAFLPPEPLPAREVIETVWVKDDPDELAQLRRENVRLKETLAFLQKTAVAKEHYYAELAWFGKRSESEVQKFRPTFWQDQLKAMGSEKFQEFKADAGRISDPNVGDWEHGFSSGCLAMSRLLLGLSHIVQDEKLCNHVEGEDCCVDCEVCTVAERRARELADFPLLDP